MLFLPILAAWAIRYASLANAFPQATNENGEGGIINGDGIALYINGEPGEAPPIAYNDYEPLLFLKTKDISSARLENAPAGYGCVFVSSRSVQNNVEGSDDTDVGPFISSPIYGSASAVYDSPEFSVTALQSPFPNAEQCLCYRLPNPADVEPNRPDADPATQEMVFLALDLESPSMGLSGTFGMFLHTFSDGAQLKGSWWEIDWPDTVIHRAAIVYAPTQTTICAFSQSRYQSGGSIEFSYDQPLVEPVRGMRDLVCTV